jgi:hypothetical protein
MKKNILFAIFLFTNIIMGQGAKLVPPDNILKAFENQHPNKKPSWDIEYSAKNDDVTFEAKFNETPKTIAYALYDKNGDFKSYKVQIPMNKLPKKAQAYMKANYSVKSFKQSFSVKDSQNVQTYESGVIKDSKFYNIVFDQDGEFYKRIQIR